MMVQLAKEIDDATQNHTFFKGYPEHPGLVLYYVDQYESYKPSADIGSDDLNGVNYSKDNLNLQSKVKKGDPIYKLVNSEEWHIYLDVSSDVVDLLSESNYVKIRFSVFLQRWSKKPSSVKKTSLIMGLEYQSWRRLPGMQGGIWKFYCTKILSAYWL